MQNSIVFSVILVFVAAGAHAQYTTDAWGNAGIYGDMHIVIPENASVLIKDAAAVFQKYWTKCTYKKIAISTQNEGRVNVWLGADVLTPDLLRPTELEDLGDEGFLIRTFTPTLRDAKKGAAKQLIIAGKTDRGTLYGVYDFFGRFMRLRWLAPGVVHSPPARFSFPKIDHRGEPEFKFREVSCAPLCSSDDLEYRRAYKFQDTPQPGPFGSDTFYDLLPPDVYFDVHPEYYAEIEGKRIAYRGDWRRALVRDEQKGQGGQLCCSNPEVAKAILKELTKMIAADGDTAAPELLRRRERVAPHPERKTWSVSQMNWSNPCQCSACSAINEKEGSPMGSLLTMVNRVAEGIEEAFPDQGHKIHTLARQYSRRPPQNIEARENVIVQLSTIDCDFTHALDDSDSTANAAFVEDIDGWSQMTEHLYIWDYMAPKAKNLAPFPSLHMLQSNIQLFSQYEVEGVFVQSRAASESKLSDFDLLRACITSRLLWDPDCILEYKIEEFMDLCSGKAKEEIAAYIDRYNGCSSADEETAR